MSKIDRHGVRYFVGESQTVDLVRFFQTSDGNPDR